MNFLPSKRFGLVIVAVLVAGGIVYSVLPSRSTTTQSSLNAEVFKNTQASAQLVPVDNPALRQAAEVDSDGDGLPDWEESLWKTNPNNTDTDGDGTSDGKEVAADRNPTVKGPRDSLHETISLEASYQKDAALAEQELSPTDKIARQFFAKYLSLKQSGEQLSPQETQQLLIDTVRLAAKGVPETEAYVGTDFTTSANNTPDALRVYGNTLGEIIRRNSFGAENELSYFGELSVNNNLAALGEIQKIASAYDQITKDLLVVSIPSSMLNAHVFLTNRTSVMADTIHGLETAQTDPVTSLVTFTNYEERAAGLAVAIQRLQTLLTESGIVFSASEPGYLLMQTRPTL